MADAVDVIVVGDVMVDVSVDREALARGGAGRHVPGAVRIRAGGSAANAAVWAASEGARVRLYGRIGRDVAGSVVRKSLEARGVESELAIDDHAPTGTTLVVRGREPSTLADPGANAFFTPGDLPGRLAGRSLLLSGYTLLDPSSEPAAVAALERAAAPLVAVDAASASRIEEYGPDRFVDATSGATMILADEREAQVLTGTTGEEAARKLAARYEQVCVRLGPGGAILADGSRLFRGNASVVRELDSIGSGDAFAGVLLARLARDDSPQKALAAACEAGAAVAASREPWPESEGG